MGFKPFASHDGSSIPARYSEFFHVKKLSNEQTEPKVGSSTQVVVRA
jgi:hypothetical protein